MGPPLGLITTAYGGTRIHQWSSPEALSLCNQTAAATRAGAGAGASDDSVHWNAMMVPYLDMRVGQVLWLQGESDVGKSDNSTTHPHAPPISPSASGASSSASVATRRT